MSTEIKAALLSRAISDSCRSSFDTESELGFYCTAVLASNTDKGILILGLNSDYRLITKGYINTRHLDNISEFMSSVRRSIDGSLTKYAVIAVHERALMHYKTPYLASVAKEASRMLERYERHLLRFYAIKGYDYENLT